MRTTKTLLASLAIAGVLSAGTASATDFDFSGTFATDDEVQLFNFSLTGISNITIFSSSWDDGGFDPILAIWDSAGNLVQEQDDGGNIGSTMSNGVSYDHGEWDTYFPYNNLPAGTYTASVVQYDNFAVSNLLSGGFTHDGNPNFTFDEGYGTEAMFNGVYSSADPRTGDWAFHILGVDNAVVGPPSGVPDGGSTAALLGLSIVGLGYARRFLRRA